MISKFYTISLIFILSISTVFSQDDFNDESSNSDVISISGIVTDSKSGSAISGANIVVDDTDLGAATDGDGSFTIENIPTGSSITASAIGYDDLTLFADSEKLDIALVQAVIEMSELEVLASRADEKTAVAYSDVAKEELSLRLGAQDIPLALN